MVCSNQRPQSSRRCSNSQSLQSLTPVLNLISVESIMPLCSPPLTPLHCSCWPNLASQVSAFTSPHCQSLCQPISLLYPVNCLSFAAQRVITTPLWQCSTTETQYSVRRMKKSVFSPLRYAPSFPHTTTPLSHVILCSPPSLRSFFFFFFFG